MTITHPPVGTAYASGYAKGRRAAQEHHPASSNPFAAGTSAHQGWSDGHYDARSARHLEIERHNALLRDAEGAN